jgi:hypothetical protein
MTSIGDVMRHMQPPAKMSQLPAPPRPEGGYPVPVLPNDLRQQVDLLEGRHRFGDFLMNPPDDKAAFDPRAADYAEQQRLAMQPATELEIRRWFTALVNVLVPGAIKPQPLFQGLLLVCGKYPAACFCDETAAALIGDNTYLPSVAEMKAVLLPIADDMRGTLHGLLRIAGAGQPRGQAREAVGYVLPPPPPEVTPRRRPLRERRDPEDFDPDDVAEQDREARANRAAQYAALGLTPADAAAQLQAKNAERGAK